MNPYIFFCGKQIPSYSLLGVVGFLVGLIHIFCVCKKKSLSFDDALYIYVFGMLGAISFSKILYVAVNLETIIKLIQLKTVDIVEIVMTYIRGGMIFFGGLYGAIFMAFICAHYLNINIKKYYAPLLPAMAIVAGFGRIGCFLTGCCYGRVTNGLCGVVFHKSEIAPNGIPLIPVQIYEAGFDIFLFLAIMWICNHTKWVFYGCYIYILMYSMFRFVLEFYRGDRDRKSVV